MGAIYKPGDAKRRRIIDKALKDLDPSIRDITKKLIESYNGEDLEQKITNIKSFENMRKLTEKK